jgi:hypothetical protein
MPGQAEYSSLPSLEVSPVIAPPKTETFSDTHFNQLDLLNYSIYSWVNNSKIIYPLSTKKNLSTVRDFFVNNYSL